MSLLPNIRLVRDRVLICRNQLDRPNPIHPKGPFGLGVAAEADQIRRVATPLQAVGFDDTVGQPVGAGGVVVQVEVVAVGQSRFDDRQAAGFGQALVRPGRGSGRWLTGSGGVWPPGSGLRSSSQFASCPKWAYDQTGLLA
jgi:hypothetical protein